MVGLNFGLRVGRPPSTVMVLLCVLVFTDVLSVPYTEMVPVIGKGRLGGTDNVTLCPPLLAKRVAVPEVFVLFRIHPGGKVHV